MSRLIKAILIVIISLSVGFGIGYLILPKPQNNIPDTKEFIERIDSLESEISILQTKKDSIDLIIDTVYVRIENNNKRYEENSNTIINNSTNDNYLFFTDYINRNRFRLDSLINNIKHEKVNY